MGRTLYRSKNAIIEDDIALIPLGGKYGTGKYAKVDLEDLDRVAAYSWIVSDRGYVITTISIGYKKRKTISMHRFIMGSYLGQELDHADRDKTNNRKLNLRSVTRSQNIWNQRINSLNTSGFKGVHFQSDSRRWRAVIKTKDGFYGLGLYDTAEDAAHAYNEKAKALFGEFAFLNQLPESFTPSSYRQARRRQGSTVPYVGIFRKREKWVAKLVYKSLAAFYLGVYDTPEEAANVYDQAAMAMHGRQAKLNFPEAYD